MFETILFPIDRSPESREAAETVAQLAQLHNSRLVILSVVPGPDEGAIEAAETLLSRAKAMFADRGLEAEVIEREGMPAFTICDVADEVEASLVVMGSRGMGLTTEGAAESTAHRVIDLSPCPVLIVP
ncbi:MAG: universal stress protein [Limnothrix sp. CACIAM 69d]|jgi:nucleotide-binding universal stress UspA family protein|nr:MAG: universal stress protein [Limnothrix sp. CACIAM 69d]